MGMPQKMESLTNKTIMNKIESIKAGREDFDDVDIFDECKGGRARRDRYHESVSQKSVGKLEKI